MESKYLWNERQLKRPPLNTFKSVSVENVDFIKLRGILEKSIQIYTIIDISFSSALLSRLIARRTNAFRSHYEFKLMRKTMIALCRLKELNIVHILEDFLALVPTYGTSTTHLPTGASFNYMMLRMQTLAKLYIRIGDCAQNACVPLFKYINNIFYINTYIVYIGLLSEIFTISKTLFNHTVDCYEELYPFQKHFQQKKNWLPDDYRLPENLGQFIDDSWMTVFQDCIPTYKNNPDMGLNIIEFDNTDTDRMFIPSIELLPETDVVANKNKNVTKRNDVKSKKSKKIDINKLLDQKRSERNEMAVKMPPVIIAKNQYQDIGTMISRDSLKPTIKLNEVSTVHHVQQFMREENDRRQNGHTSNLLSVTEWQEFQQQVDHIIITSQGRVCVKKFKKLWSKTFK